jgi:hypothetical protein
MARNKKVDAEPLEAGLVRIRNVSPRGGLDVPLIGASVKRGATVDVSEAHARILLRQDIWELVDANGLLKPEPDSGADSKADAADEPADGADEDAQDDGADGADESDSESEPTDPGTEE